MPALVGQALWPAKSGTPWHGRSLLRTKHLPGGSACPTKPGVDELRGFINFGGTETSAGLLQQYRRDVVGTAGFFGGLDQAAAALLQGGVIALAAQDFL